MNPWTLITLWAALRDGEKHLFDLCFETRLHPSTIYNANRKGWLAKVEPSHFSATEKLHWEVKRYEPMRKVRTIPVK